MTQYQLLPPLTEEEYETLKADIAERGVMVPIETDDQGNVLDGHHRLRACQELGIENYQTLQRLRMTEEQKVAHILALNLARRHLTQEQRNESIRKTKALTGWSAARIAALYDVSPDTVSRDIAGSAFAEPDYVIGKDNKKYPAKKRPRQHPTIDERNKREREKGQDLAPQIQHAPATIFGVSRAGRIVREEAAEARRQNGTKPENTTIGSCDLRFGDFRTVLTDIPDESVDLVFTDPPYQESALPLWGDLARFTARVLKPSGMLVAYTGAMYLPTIIATLCEHLTYWWCGAVILDGPHSRVHARNIAQGSKPMLFFVKDSFTPNLWIEDTRHSESEQKQEHDWQQSIGPALYYLAELCPSGGTVVDPFLGGGTTALAAKALGRRFYGAELDPEAYGNTNDRLRQAQP